MEEAKRPKSESPMIHQYGLRLDDYTWGCLLALRKEDLNFNLASWMRNEIRQLYSQRIWYRDKWKKLDYETKKESANGRRKKETRKASDATKRK